MASAIALQVRSIGQNEYTIFLEDLLARYLAHGTPEILEQAWAYALTHVFQEEETLHASEAFTLSQTRLKLLIEEKGPLDTLADLFVWYNPFFHKIAYCVLYDYELARDGVIIAWHKVYDWLVAVSNDKAKCEDPLPYLCKIVINTSRTLRRKEYQQKMKIQLAGRNLEEQERRRVETPEDALVRLEKEQIVREEVEKLPPKQRLFLAL